ncbi:unnamed protein product [Cladocopium goreaui]|uniref:Helicase domino n=1 Tax=Cladocopium goreaui TaxID=2562237 RepID=A0A9P1DG14_9DINO|nr:unnamed protein product [Cladocopium goreaui]
MVKPRVLCLHGRGLNSAYFRGQLLGLIRRNPELDFFFLEGHLPAEVAPEALGTWRVALKPQQRRAWQYFTLCSDVAQRGAEPANRWKAGHDAAEGFQHVWEEALRESRLAGGFYASVGFSQGANVAAALLAKQAASHETLGLRCSVNLCGGIWGFWSDGCSMVTGESAPSLPLRGVASLHILGLTDPYLAQSKSLVEGYAPENCERRVLEHSGGHTPFPLERPQREEIMDEVSKFLKKYAETASPDLGAAPGRRTQPMQPSELETASSELASDNFDRRCMSNKITTEVPTLLLRHPIRERLGHRLDGLHWLATLHDKDFNGILADEMGLGKTIMTIALLAHLAIQKEVWGPHLIVVPSSVLLNWVKELKKWTPGLKVCAYFGDLEERRLKRRGWGVEDAFHVCVVSYSVALQDVRFLKRRRWYYMILDEAQHIKNCRSQKWQQLMRFNTERRLLLTGTPLQNNLTELWSLMHFLMPDMFQSYHDFKEFFSDPLQLALHEKRVDQEQDLVARLHKVLRPFLLRRLKSEVERQLPNKHEYVVRCPLSRRQQVLYEEFMQRCETQRVLKKGDYLSMMGILMQLRKVCNHPELFEPRCAVTAFVMCQLEFQLPGDVLLALWQCIAGRRPGEENFCSLLMPLLSLWRLELSMMQLSRADLPLNEVIEVELPMKRRRIMPTLPASPLRKHLSPQSQRFLDESYLAHLGQEEERRDQRRSVAVAVDYLMWLVMQGRPWIGSNGLQLLSQCVSSSLCSRGRRSFLWPEPRRSSSVFCDARSAGGWECSGKLVRCHLWRSADELAQPFGPLGLLCVQSPGVHLILRHDTVGSNAGPCEVGPSFKCHATGTVAALPTALGPLFKADMLRRWWSRGRCACRALALPFAGEALFGVRLWQAARPCWTATALQGAERQMHHFHTVHQDAGRVGSLRLLSSLDLSPLGRKCEGGRAARLGGSLQRGRTRVPLHLLHPCWRCWNQPDQCECGDFLRLRLEPCHGPAGHGSGASHRSTARGAHLSLDQRTHGGGKHLAETTAEARAG